MARRLPYRLPYRKATLTIVTSLGTLEGPHVVGRVPLELECLVAALLAELLELGLEDVVGEDGADSPVEGIAVDLCKQV